MARQWLSIKTLFGVLGVQQYAAGQPEKAALSAHPIAR
jgi:hypothetical protein